MKFPTKPQKGDKALQSIYNTVCDIVDYLPSLNVVGDNKTTYVNHSVGGTTIHAVQPHSLLGGKGQTYYAGSGIAITSGNMINALISAGPNIHIDYNSGYFVISGTPAGSGTSPEPGPGGHEYYDGRFITISSDYSINCTLYALSQLYNPPFVESSNIVMPNSLTACNNTVDISQVGQIYSNHFIQTRDILYDGLGTKVSLAWMRNPFGDQDLGGTNGIVQGLQVDLTLSGGRYTDVILHKHVFGAYDPNTGTRYDPPTESRVDCLLTGTYDRYPHTSGFIDVVPVEMEDGKVWGVISTNLHAGSGIAIDQYTGQISVTGAIEPVPVPVENECIGYPNYTSLYNDDNGSVSGIGISWLLPVSAGLTYRYYTDARDESEQTPGTYKEYAFADYAPSIGETGDSRRAIANGVPFVPSANGWLRVSVFDDGTHQGKCLRFYQGEDTTYQYATPLYRFHSFTNYQAGAGIWMQSGIISCMLQTNHNQLANGSGIISTGLYTGNPYNPTLTGIAIGLSSAWAEDLANINKHTLVANKNKVLSSNNYGNLVWADNVQIPPPVVADFKAPDFAKLQVTNDAGETAIGLGTTYLVPVSGGSTVRYSADGGTIIARWAPVKGSSKTAFEVTTTNKTTTDDGYVRISVIDDGTLSAGCLRLYVDNKDIPLHKFAKFNYSSGAIYEAGRYMDIQTTSTRINAETELEEEYTLENPIINNMLTGGTFIEIQEEENNQTLEYPRINCKLTGDGQTVFINEQGVISAKVGSTIPTPVANRVLSATGNGTMSWEVNTAGSSPTPTPGPGGGGNCNWPHWENMCGSGHLVHVQKWYTTQDGGWLRISNRYGSTFNGQCNSVYIDPVVPPAGVEGQNHIGLGTGINSYFLPVPPGSSFWIGLPSNAECWFDGTTTPPTHTTDDVVNPMDIVNNSTSAVEACGVAESEYNNAYSAVEAMQSDYEEYIGSDRLYEPDWYKDKYYATVNASGAALEAKNSCISYANACQTVYNKYDEPDKSSYTQYVTNANNAVTDATNYATSAANMVPSASYWYDLAYDHWLSAHPEWFTEHPDFTKYDQ